jgi:hypothetical protein
MSIGYGEGAADEAGRVFDEGYWEAFEGDCVKNAAPPHQRGWAEYDQRYNDAGGGPMPEYMARRCGLTPEGRELYVSPPPPQRANLYATLSRAVRIMLTGRTPQDGDTP